MCVCLSDMVSANSVSVSFQSEQLTDALWAELTPLLQQHYVEIAKYQDIPLDPDKVRYAAMQAAGGVVSQVSFARDDHSESRHLCGA